MLSAYFEKFNQQVYENFDYMQVFFELLKRTGEFSGTAL